MNPRQLKIADGDFAFLDLRGLVSVCLDFLFIYITSVDRMLNV